MIEDLNEIIEESAEELSLGNTFGLINELTLSSDNTNQIDEFVYIASTVATTTDLLSGDPSVSTILNLLRAR